jgi:ubiquinone/menaquinone biosynthesis C-methylase UbiE
MNQSTNYDPVADRYDTSRDWPEAVAAAFVAALAFVLPPGEPILEIGVGTGRIARPLSKRGLPLTGVDVSMKMLVRCQSQLDSAMAIRLLQADAAALPFADSSFGGVYTVHVFHLVAGWQKAIEEIRRILRSDGVYLNSTSDDVASDIVNHMDVGWETVLVRKGFSPLNRPGVRSKATFEQQMRQLGAEVELIKVGRWTEDYSPRLRLQQTAARMMPVTWHIPAPMFQTCLTDYERWLKAQYNDLDTRLELVKEVTLEVWRWE